MSITEQFLKAYDSKDRDFEMFTKAGNKKCQSITRAGIKKIFGKKRISQEELLSFVGEKMAKASKDDRFGEILDSIPPYHIKRHLVYACEVAGYNFDFDKYDLTDQVFKALDKLNAK